MVTQEELKAFSALPMLERKIMLRTKQVEMFLAASELTTIVRDLLGRALVADVSQAELALLAARQMCDNKDVRKAIDDLLQYAARLHEAASDNLFLGDIA